MKKQIYSRINKVLSLMTVLAILLCSVAGSGFSSILQKWGGNTLVKAEEAAEPLGEPQVHAELPPCEFDHLLYKGENKPAKQPKTAEYEEGYAAPRHLSLSDYMEQAGTADSFDA